MAKQKNLSGKTSERNGGSALARGLKVLVAVNDLETVTISAVVAATGLAKPTVVRLMQTLVEEGYVGKDPETSTYAVTSRVGSLARGLVGQADQDAALQEVLDGLAMDLKWPTEFLRPDGHSMVIEMNNRKKAPIKLSLFERRRFPMFKSASGIAYAASQPKARSAEMVVASGLGQQDMDEAMRAISRARSKKYAIYQYRDLAANLSVLSIVVPGGLGALSVPHFDDVLSEEHIVAQVLPRLRKAADEIAGILE